jgi:hypothetical protein
MNRRASFPGTRGPVEAGRLPGRAWAWLATLAVVALLVFGAVGPAALTVTRAAAQTQPTPDPANQGDNSTPTVPRDPTAPQSQTQTQPTPTPSQRNQSQGQNQSQNQSQSSSASNQDSGTEPGAPAVLAHGLAYISGDQVVWQVRETEMPDEPEGISSSESVMLQRDGATIIRNDVTAKRAKLDPGEAYFIAADDPYTVVSDTVGSMTWILGLVPSEDVADDAFYESPLIDDLEEGVYDMALVRYVLQPGESADLPDHTGPALLMVSAGEVEVEDESGLSTLAASDGQLMPGEGTVTNNGSSPVVYLVAMLGDQVDDTTAAAPQAPSTTNGSSTAETTDTTGSTDTTTETTDTTTTEAPAEEPATDTSGQFQTSINVTAVNEIYLTITADGVTVFDGTLPAGASSGPVVGSVFEVYTSSGVNTSFTNACGETFQMGYEEGEASYTLTATAESCAP